MSAGADADSRTVALTGATGFIGRRLVVALAAAGWRVRLLLRRDPAVREWQGIEPQVVAGDLSDARALDRLVDGSTHVIHVAGLIKDKDGVWRGTAEKNGTSGPVSVDYQGNVN